MDDNDKKDILNAFMQYDQDKDGFITIAEATTCMKTLGYNPSDNDILQILKSSDGQLIGKDQFIKIVMELGNQMEESELKKAFAVLDPTNSKKLDWFTFSSLLKSCGASDKEINGIRDFCDIQADDNSFDYLNVIQKLKK